jgi:Icc-related predicted phosphoesterase
MLLMTHAPAYDTLDHIPSGVPVGSKAIRAIIDEFKPILALSGHIHEDYGIKDLGGTICVNPGPAMDRRAAVITITDDQVAVKLIGPEGA